MKIEAHILSHDEEQMLEYSLRHYTSFCDTVIVHDGGPVGWSSITAKRYGAHAEDWDTSGQLNDQLAEKLKNECWLETEADWVICADADELFYFPQGVVPTLERYSKIGGAVIRPHGFEMFSDTWPITTGQIYEEVKMGARDDKWYAKPILFSPHKVSESGFGIGAHESRPVLKNGRVLTVDGNWPLANPPTYLLHCHQLGGLERIAARYDATRKRLAKVNEAHNWGNFKPGLVHAQEKRDLILPRLEQVIS